ncbi:hypothetical protein MJO28_016664 [Puccinia striiformis f. sp. tritici]|uniref:Uncharacterized protein n=1 Tax=Puccinia striiformis f. sp. tritici TaxID=168172 RepID=A0ACC0DNL3_9BASI|nr:hypothetical protein MJO29_015982 [Puccinia striiformis f. sp. tritici]KAI7935793.1 hypothetical protein MJO28_016664 [Puccinia striiformis f. sp. tritici]
MSHSPLHQPNPTSVMTDDLSASIDALPPRRGQDLFGAGGIPIGRPGPVGHHHSRTKSKTDFLDLADSTTRLGTSPELNSRLEQKRAEHEVQRAEQKRVFAAQMRALEAQHESEERELLGAAASAPTTPPRSDSEVDHILLGASESHRSHIINDPAKYGNIGLPKGSFREFANNSKSVPASRRHSGQDQDSLGLDKLSLGVNGSSIAPIAPNGVARGNKAGGGTNDGPSVTSFLFDDELDTDLHQNTFGGKYLQMNTDDDKFPILVRRDSFPGLLSASSAALDLAPLAQTPPRHSNLVRQSTTARGNDWSPFDSPSNFRTMPHSHESLADVDRGRLAPKPQSSTPVSFHKDARSSPVSDRGASPHLNRVSHMNGGIANRSALAVSRNSTGTGSSSNGNAHSGQQVITNGSISTSPKQEKKNSSLFPPSPVDMHAALNKGFSVNDLNSMRSPLPIGSAVSDSGRFGSGSFGLNGGNVIDSNLNKFRSAPLKSANAATLSFGFDAADGFDVGGGGPLSAGKSRRDPETNRFANIRLEDMQGDMFGLCKDQHGCRFLQKKLEEGDPTHRDMIFAEIYPHFGELMTDAFGNYLSQKLLEYSSDDQRDLLIESISGELVSISLNMHGTRAAQKMIDFLSTQRQVQSLIVALNLNVVTLIKDLNGNHVIQKCLNHLPPEDNQFIYNAVAANCIEVATHRHGCCVLQRCIDHASESQRIQLVTEITYNSLTLVQDPFGNYVVQYVLDLNDSRFIEAIVRQFLGNVCALSMQKFSSNVVEKCIRVSDLPARRALVEELSGRQQLERLLRDSFANYVVQTALDYSEPQQRAALVDNIRPILPLIRNTPYGKRIQSKIQRENLDPLRTGGAFQPLMSPGYFLSSPHLAGSPAHMPHHVHNLIEGHRGSHGPTFMSSALGSGAATHPLLTNHHHLSSQGQLASPGFAAPWSASSANSPMHMNYPGMSLNHDHRANDYAPFM